MSASHTPGPWEIRSRHETRGSITGVSRYVFMPNGAAIVVAHLVDPTPAQDEEARANARLIAAAPELLVALKYVVDTYGFDSSTDSAIWKTACAAIAKATVPQS